MVSEDAEAKRDAVREGFADADAGRVVPHEEVRRWLLDLAAGRRTERPHSQVNRLNR
ncbi:MAG TPA: CopG family transcriptional regulator [Azospirillum sp.]